MSQGSQSVDKISAIQLWKRSLCFHLFPVHLHSQIFNFSSAEPKLLADNANVWISKAEITSFCHKPEGRGPLGSKPSGKIIVLHRLHLQLESFHLLKPPQVGFVSIWDRFCLKSEHFTPV